MLLFSSDVLVCTLPERSLTCSSLLKLVQVVSSPCQILPQLQVGRWDCHREACGVTVEYDGGDDGLFAYRRRNRKKQWIVFTRGLV